MLTSDITANIFPFLIKVKEKKSYRYFFFKVKEVFYFQRAERFAFFHFYDALVEDMLQIQFGNNNLVERTVILDLF